MTFKDQLIEDEKRKAQKRVERVLEQIDGLYSRHIGSEEIDLLCLMLTVPTKVIHAALGYNLYVDIPQRTKDSDEFPKELFFGFLNEYELLEKLEFIQHFVGYWVLDDGDPATAYYKEIRPKKGFHIDSKRVHCEPDDHDAVPYIISSSEHYWNLFHKKTSYKVQCYVDCLNYYIEQEKNHAVLMFEFDGESVNGGEIMVDGKTFGQYMTECFDTPDAVFGKQLVVELKEKYPAKEQNANS